MKQKLFIFLALIFLFFLLIGLNAVSYVQKEKMPDTEDAPNRSTYNVGATGTRAFYDLLAETGVKVKRWQEPFPRSGKLDPEQFSTFVIIGKTRKEFEQKELEHILNWVAAGGKLVIIDRLPNEELISGSLNWSITKNESENPTFMIDPSNQTQMVGKTSAVKPVQPTLYTMEVNAVQPSKFASSININRLENDDVEEVLDSPSVATSTEKDIESSSTTTEVNEDEIDSDEVIGTGNNEADDLFKTPTPTPITPISLPTSIPTHKETGGQTNEINSEAPVIHMANDEINLLVDFPFGLGEIVFLSDPYIVTNSGIKLVDNAQLVTNIVLSRQGIIAFDEYHQGLGSSQNRLFEYFSGTPVVPIFLQIFLIVALLFYSQSRRFARALPNDEPSRLSKLEYVSAMAQLQGRTKAFDLAIENIYKDFRRRVSRLFNVDNHTSTRKELAEKIAERLNKDVNEIEDIMYKCEDIMHGEPTKKKETVYLISRLRELEELLGLRRGKNNRAKR